MNQHPIQPEALEFLGHKDSFYSVGAIVFFEEFSETTTC